jgi:hypothetical protein
VETSSASPLLPRWPRRRSRMIILLPSGCHASRLTPQIKLMAHAARYHDGRRRKTSHSPHHECFLRLLRGCRPARTLPAGRLFPERSCRFVRQVRRDSISIIRLEGVLWTEHGDLWPCSRIPVGPTQLAQAGPEHLLEHSPRSRCRTGHGHRPHTRSSSTEIPRVDRAVGSASRTGRQTKAVVLSGRPIALGARMVNP